MSSKITDRQLESWIDDANSVLNDGGAQVEEMSAASTILALCEHIQECRKAEPVADVVAWSSPNEERTCDIRWRRHDVAPGPLYSAPQSPVTYPQKLPCPVRLEPGLLFGKGVTTSTMLSALQRRAEYYAELEVMTPEEREKHDASIEEFKSMLPQGDIPQSEAIEDIKRIFGMPQYSSDQAVIEHARYLLVRLNS